jgi:hypothetical protein
MMGFVTVNEEGGEEEEELSGYVCACVSVRDVGTLENDIKIEKKRES